MNASKVGFGPFEQSLLPRVVAFWNCVFSAKRNFYPISEEQYRRRIVGQAAFDPQGLIVALADDGVVGMAHAIKPVPPDVFIYGRRRCRENGCIAVLAVASEWRRRGVGSALLARAEAYLARHVAQGKLIYVGDYDVPLYHTLEGPRQPFWGDAEIMGIAEGEAELADFLARRGYRSVRREGQEVTMVAVLASARLEPGRPALEELGLHEVRVSDERPWPGRIGWYPQDAPPGYAHRLFGDYTHQVIALARGDTITSHIEWYPMAEAGCVALWDLAVAQADRGAGLGSYLLDKGLWTMAQQGYRTVELHTHTTKNALAFEMYRRRGFQVMEKWIALQKEAGG